MRNYGLFLVLLLFIIYHSRAVDLSIIASSFENTGYCFNLCVDEFNKYAKENNLDIHLELNLLTISNFSVSIESTNAMYETLLKRKDGLYDVYLYDGSWVNHFCPYFIDLNEHLDKDHINMYNENIISQLGRCNNNKLIGLPLMLNYEALYSNKELLKKYNKEVPKTWQQLLDTGKEILTKERELNNTELIGYNGLLFDIETGFCSIYEFIHSCRETADSPFPDLTNSSLVDDILLLKEIKSEISSYEIFNSNLDYTFEKLMAGNAIFLKFYVYYLELMRKDSPYEMTSLPGIREGISSTILTGYNVGIARNIDKNKLQSALEVVKFFTSRAMQKSLVLQNQIISAITSIYDEEDVCASIKNCKMFRYAQPIAKPVELTNDFIDYSSRFTNYFYDFLYNDKNPAKTLKAMDDLAKIYYIHVYSKETVHGLIMIIIFSITTILILLSLLFLNVEKYKYLYSFLPKPLWCIIVIGVVCILSAGFTKIGMVTSFKCHLSNTLFSVGYSFIYVPILCKLLIHFPEENKFSKWVKDNKYKFISMLIIINGLSNGLAFIGKYTVKNIIVEEGENYQICKMEHLFTLFINIIIMSYAVLIILTLLLLIFIEWNLSKLHYDIRLILSSIYLNIITFVIFSIFNLFRINNYVLYFTLYEIIIYIISIVNYFSLYGIRKFSLGILNKDTESEIIEKIRVHESTYEKSDNLTTNYSQTKSSFSKESEITKNSSYSLYSKILEYHYYKEGET